MIREELTGRLYSHLSADFEDSSIFADSAIFDSTEREGGEASGFTHSIRAVNNVCTVAYGDGHVLAITKSGQLYCAGDNTHGQTGSGHLLRQSSPGLVPPPTMLKRRITAVAAGRWHSAALSDTGDMYTWGRGFEGQLGLSDTEQLSATPRYVTWFSRRGKVTAIACGDLNTAAVTAEGLHTWGEGSSGQLGHTGRCTAAFQPGRVEQITAPVVSMSIGASHMVVADEAGEVWSWGLNTLRQLGHTDNKKYVTTPEHPILPLCGGAQEHEAGNKIVMVATGPHTSLCVSSTGRVFTWGSAENQLLGHKVAEGTTCIGPQVVDALDGYHAAQVTCSRNYAVAFVPRVVMKVSPDSAALAGGTDLLLEGHAMPSDLSGKCDVRFSSPDGEQQKIPADYDHHTGQIKVRTPCFSCTGKTSVSVKFEGSPWCLELPDSSVTVYKPTDWLSMSALLGPSIGGTALTVVAENVLVSPFAAARVQPSAKGAEPLPVTSLKMDGEQNTINVTMPEAPAGAATLQVAFNGVDYESVKFEFSYYKPAELTTIEPGCVPHQLPTEFTIAGTGLFCPDPAELLQMRFTSANEGEQPVVVQAKHSRIGSRAVLGCNLEPWVAGGERTVEVTFNGLDYQTVPVKLAVYEPMNGVKFVPNCGPVEGATKVTLSAVNNLIDYGVPTVRVNSGNRRVDCTSTRAGPGKIEWVMPVWDTPPVVVDPDAEPVEATEPVEAPDVEAVDIGVAINGFNFQPAFAPFTYYKAPVLTAIYPPQAPAEMEEALIVRLDTGEAMCHTSEDMKVRLIYPVVDAADGAEPEAPVVLEFSLAVEHPAEETEEDSKAKKGKDDPPVKDLLAFTVPVDGGAVAGDTSVHIALNGQQFSDTGLKLSWK